MPTRSQKRFGALGVIAQYRLVSLAVASVAMSTWAACVPAVPGEDAADSGTASQTGARPHADAGAQPEAGPDAEAGAHHDGGSDGGSACNASSPFSTPTIIASLSSPQFDEVSARFLPGELTIDFVRGKPNTGDASYWAFRATRPSIGAAFGGAEIVPTSEAGGILGVAPLSDDVLYVDSSVTGMRRIHRLIRDEHGDNRGLSAAGLVPVTSIVENGTTLGSANPFVTEDGQNLLFITLVDRSVQRPARIYIAPRDASGAFANATYLRDVPGDAPYNPAMTNDGKTLYFTHKGNLLQPTIWRATRASTADSFGSFEEVPELNGGAESSVTWISADGCHVLLYSNRTSDPHTVGTFDLYEAWKAPVL